MGENNIQILHPPLKRWAKIKTPKNATDIFWLPMVSTMGENKI
jgi:hypothetical protein